MAAVHMFVPSKEIFDFISSGNIEELKNFSPEDLKPYLPFLVGYTYSTEHESKTDHALSTIEEILLDIPESSRVASYFSVDFDAIREFVLNEKPPVVTAGSGGVRSFSGICVDFEKEDILGKLKILVKELLYVFNHLKTSKSSDNSELLECDGLRWEIGDMLCVLVLKISSHFPLVKVVEALLKTRESLNTIIQLVANLPSSFDQVVQTLIVNGESQDEISTAGRQRTLLLRQLCAFNPQRTLLVQQLALTNLKQPSLVLYLGLDQAGRNEGDNMLRDPVVMAMSSLVLKGSSDVRAWFGQYIKLNQHKYRRVFLSALTEVRKYLISKLTQFEDKSESAPIHEHGEQPGPPVAVGTQHLLERGPTEEDMDTDKLPETKSTDEEVYPFPLATPPLSDVNCMELSLLMKVFCGMKLSGLFVWKSEGYIVLRMMTGLVPPQTNSGVNLIKVMFAILLACPFLISTKARERAVLRWFHWLVENQHNYDRNSRGTSYGEMLLMAAIHFQERQMSQIQDLVSSTLGFSVQHAVRPGKHSDIRELFLSVFSEDIVCTQALRVPPTPRLNAKMTGFYPIHCVYNLLKSQAFSNHAIPVTSWVYNQMLMSNEPIHPVLPQLVQELVTAILSPPTRSMYQDSKPVFNQPPIPERQLLSTLQCSESTGLQELPLVSQSLILFYVLLYHQKLLKNLKAFSTWTKSFPLSYSPRLLSTIPVKYLLAHMRGHRSNYAVLYPSIMKLVTTHLPHVAMVTYWTTNLSSNPASLCYDRAPPPDRAGKVLHTMHSSPSKVLMLVRSLSHLQPTLLIPYSQYLLSTLPLLHDNNVPRPIQEGVCLLWQKLNTVMTESLWVNTTNALCDKNGERYTREDLVEDPLLVLKCNPSVFQCPPLLEVILQVLNGFMSLSRVWIEEQGHIQSVVSSNQPGSQDPMLSDKDTIVSSYQSLQESAVVQMLLEICLHGNKGEESYGPLLSIRRELHCIVCSCIHQMFIANPMLAKLVHFQGYPTALIEMMVDGVPSMHICLDFIAELLDKQEAKKQQFGLQLAAQLLAQYPLPTTTDTTRLFMKKLNSLMGTVPRQGHVDMFVPILPFLVSLCKAFPPLVEEVTMFLIRLGRCHIVEPANMQNKTSTESASVKVAMSILFKDSESYEEHQARREEKSVISTAIERTFKLIAGNAVSRA